MPESPSTFFLFLGDCDREGATSKLKAAGRGYKKKRLESGLENWAKIQEILEDPALVGVLVKLTGWVYESIARENYKPAAEKLFASLQRIPHVVFAHDSLVLGESAASNVASDQPGEDNFGDYFHAPSEEVIRTVKELLEKYEINILPYKRNAEMSVLAAEFLNDNEKNLVFRFYVPSGRMWALEAEKILQLFRDYLTRVSNFRVRQDQFTTRQGTVYEFYGESKADADKLPREFEEFGKLLDLCVSSPIQAAQMLEGREIEPAAIHRIIDRYAKEARRLHIDLKQERERRFLSIRHRMESELGDVIQSKEEWDLANLLVEETLPQVGGVSSTLGFSGVPKMVNGPSNVTINIQPQVIGSIHGIVAHEISGAINMGLQAKEILGLIDQYGGTQAQDLKAAVHVLEDEDVKQGQRTAAGHKLKAFLAKVSDKTQDIAFDILQRYIEHKLGF